ncbi:tsf, partial [Mucuna pruriens]
MNCVIPCSVGNVPLIPETCFLRRKNNSLKTTLSLSRSSSQSSVKHGSSTLRFLLPPFVASGPFPPNKRRYSLHKKYTGKTFASTTTKTEVAVEESNSSVADEDSAKASETPSDEVGKSEDSSPKSVTSPAPVKTRLSRSARRSEMPPVKNEDLIPGATFTGKVKSVQPFGAFIDFGAFTDGLVHVSQLSDGYVKDVASVVSVGQEVKVKLIEVNTETKRISLSMRENDDTVKPQQRKDATISAEKVGSGRRNTSKPRTKKDDMKKSTKFVEGQDLEGTVKNLARSGSFISLPDGEEGFLPISEEPDEVFGNVMGISSLQVGQEVSVRVLRINRGQVTLTMKKEDVAVLDSEIGQGVVHVATNPFALAFRKNKDIATFLEERKKIQNTVETPSVARTSKEIKEIVKQGEIVLDVSDAQGEPESSKGLIDDVPSEVKNNSEDEISEKEVDMEANTVDAASAAIVDDERDTVSNISSPGSDVESTSEKEAEVTSGNLTPEGNVPTTINQIIEEATQTDVTNNNVKTESPLEIANENVIESEVDHIVVGDEKQSQTYNSEEEFSAVAPTDSDEVDPSPDKISSITGSDITSNAYTPQETADGTEDNGQVPLLESNPAEVVKDSIDDPKKVQQQTPATENENSFATVIEDKDRPIISEENNNASNADGQTDITASDQATISPTLVKQLREETGTGMMDCKKALSETGGDIIKAQEFLRKKGLASAEKKASRVTAEGRISSYIHDSRIGVLVEVNCETDFVSRGEIFKELVDDIAMQVAACPQVEYLVTEDVPEEILNKEKEIEVQKDDLLSKPEQIRSKIVEGRIRKRLEELALLEQPYIKNDKVAVKDWIKQTISTVGENIKVKRFVRFNLGEGLEKKTQDFAADVAAQTVAKPVPTEQAVVAEATEQKPSTTTVSATLVKQLREETGAGMMDCKKALAETGGDLEKAQEYLRKKGLSTADKKSSRLAAEGRIGSYIHDSRIGVLIEVNCETDFVGRSEKFKELVDDLAMQVVASPQVQCVSIEDIPERIVSKEKELEMQREDIVSKPENIRERIVEGRVSKRLGELALLEQPFIKDESVLVKDLVKQTMAALGENIKVRRFVRFTLGETAESEATTAAWLITG